MSAHPLRDFAEAYSAFNGEVTFYMVPFPTFETDRYLIDFQREHPQIKWVHQETGEEQFSDPVDGPSDDAVAQAQREASPWQEVHLWSQAQSIFLACVPNTVDIEFKGKLSRTTAKALRAFWDGRNGSVEHNWELFQQTIGREAALEWLAAYDATRDSSMDGDEALATDPDEDADPNV